MLGLTGLFVVATLLVFIGSWLLFDLWIVCKFGQASGMTISFTIYQASQKYPATPFLTGLVIGLLGGHLFLKVHGLWVHP